METHRWSAVSRIVVILLALFTLATPVFAAAVYDSGSGTMTVSEYDLDYAWTTTYEKANASDPDDGNDGSGSVTHSDGVFTLTAKSSKYNGGFLGYGKKSVYNYTTILTITNNGDYGCEITYNTSGDMGTVTGAKKELAKGESVSFTLETTTDDRSTSRQDYTGTVTITAIEVFDKVSVGFASFPNGSYTYQIGDTVTSVASGAETATQELSANSTVTLTAGDAAEGYEFYGWMMNGALLSTDSPYDYSVNVAGDIYPAFIPSAAKTAGEPFKVGDNAYMFWHLAFEAAKLTGNPVLVNQNTTLPTSLVDNGLISGHKYSDFIGESNGTVKYIVPSGTKLLIPFGSGDTAGSFGGNPNNYLSQAKAWEMYNSGKMAKRNFVHRCLTVPSGTKIDCYGAINVNGQRQETGQPYIGVSIGGYGKIQLDGAGTEQLTVYSGGVLYAYGYITGSGKVNVLSGATLHELMQVCDWPGGSNAYYWRGKADEKTLFMISQYYIQNIETTLQVNSGAMAYAEMTIHGSSTTIARSVEYIGNSTGLFRLGSSSYLIRTYDTAADRVEYTLYGSASLGEISVTFDFGITYTLKSSSYVLPITGNMTLRIANGATMAFDKNAALLPGSQIIIDKGGTVNLSGRAHIIDVADFSKAFFFDRTNLTSGNTDPKFNALPYVATLNNISPRAKALKLSAEKDADGKDLKQYYLEAKTLSASALVQVDGTLNVSGQLLTTNGSSSPSANKAIIGSGVINYTSTPAITDLKGGENATMTTMTSTYGLANIDGVGNLKPLASGTYYGQESGEWYNYVVKADSAENLAAFTNITEAAAAEGNTVTRYNSETKAQETIANVLGVVSTYLDSAQSTQSVFSFDMAAGSGPVITGGGDNIVVTPVLNAEDGTVSYGLSGVSADVTLGATTEGTPTTIKTVAPNAGNAEISSVELLLPDNADISAYFSDPECTTAAAPENIGGTVYTPCEAVAAIGPEKGTYALAYMTAAEAVAAADGTNSYVTVLADRTMTDPIVIAAAQNITLDLNGKALDGGTQTTWEPLTNNGTLRLINGTITYAAAGTKTKPLATVRNNGTIEYIEGVTLKETYKTSSTYVYALYNAAGAHIKEIRSGEFRHANQTVGYVIYNLGSIDVIGTSGNTVTLYGRRGIEMGSNATIGVVGGAGSTVNITGGQRCIDLPSSSAKITTIGDTGSTMNFYTGEYQMHKSGIYVAGTVTTIGAEGSTLNFYMTPLATHYMESYGINVTSSGKITTIGAAGSVISIEGTSAQTAVHTGDAKYMNHMHGIINAGTITNIGSKATAEYPASKLTINVSHAGVNGDVTGIKNTNIITNLGAEGATIAITANYTGTDTARHGYGIYNSGTITTFAADSTNVEVVSNQYGVYNAGAIGTLNSLTAVSTDTTGSYYALYNTKTVTVNGGYFHHASGAANAVKNESTLTYKTDYGLSEDPKEVTLLDGTTKYPCYYVKHVNHTEETIEGTPATCTEDGLTDGVKCSVCDEVLVEREVIPAGHSYGELIAKQEEVHTQTELKGSVAAHYLCSGCGTYFTEAKEGTTLEGLTGTVPEHTYGDWVNTDAQKHWKVCSECELESEKQDHTYTDDADADCNDCGYSRHTCTGTLADGKAATCTEAGWKDYVTCTCGKYYSDAACENQIPDLEVWKAGDGKISATGHVNTTTTTVDATCTQNGSVTVTCDKCGETVSSEVINATGHEKTTTTTVDATCTQNGSVTVTCDKCGETVSSEVINATGHEKTTTTTVDATCTVDGSKKVTCDKCGETVSTEVIKAEGHNEVTDAAKAPTCTETGLTEGSHCDVCGEVLKAQDVVDAKGHTPVVDAAKAPTCTETGLTEGSHCDVCGEVLKAQDVVDAKGHTPVVDAAKAPTCTETGLTEGSHCDVCGEVLVKQETVKALGHDYKAVVTAPTFDENGYTTHTCTRCGDSYVDSYVDKLIAVAKIGEQKYQTLTEALAEGGNVTLLADIETDNAFVVEKKVVLDLNGYDVKTTQKDTTGDGVFRVIPGGDLTINGQGVINGVGNNKYCIAIWADGGKVTINDGTYTNVGAGGDDHYDLIYVKNGGQVVINGGTFIAETPAWTLNCHDDSYKAGNASITVTDGEFYGFNPYNNACEGANTNFVAEGKHASADEAGVYTIHNCTKVTLDAKDPDCTNTGLTAGEKCSYCGEILVAQKEVAALGHEEVTDAAKAPTCTATGLTEGKHCSVCNEVLVAQNVVDALGHTEVTDEAKAPTCTATGLTEGEHCDVCGEVLVKQETVAALGHSWTAATFDAPKTCSVCGATEGEKLVAVAKVGDQRYETLAEAVAAAESGDTVTLLTDATGAGVVIDKNITIDFGGYTYTVNKAVGSVGTETLGLQILQGNDVTLKNGTLTSTKVTDGKEVKVLIQNYADLTLTDMTLEGKNPNILYGLSNNSGSIALTGETNIEVHEKAVAFDVYDYSAAGYAIPEMTVNTTGKITGKIEVSENAKLAISGGTFSKPVQESWCAEGFIPEANNDGTYGVKVGQYVAQVGDTKYETLAEAVAAANPGNTVTLLTDATGAGVVIDKDITIDFGGHTYTVNKAVGSAGTETLGLQILKDNDVVLKNGTLTSAAVTGGKEVKVLIQNYADLTLDGLTLEGNNSNILYGLSNNSGVIALTGETNIEVHEKAVAFDVYDYSAAGYAIPEMTVDTTGKIIGKIEVSENAKLAISGGTFSQPVQKNWCAEGFTPAKVGDAYTVGTLPNAEIKDLGYLTVDKYQIYNGSLTEGKKPIDLQVAMEFIAKDTPEQAKDNAFGNYTTDFFITMDGIEGGSFVADGCYLAGHYGSFGWIMVPLDGMTIQEGVIYPVITSVGFDFSYVDICADVKDFKCGIYFPNEIIQANPNMTVTLTLGLSEDMEQAQAGKYITVDAPYTYQLEDMLRVAEVNGTKYATLTAALEAAGQGDTVKLLADIETDSAFVVDKKVVLDLNGYDVKTTQKDTTGDGVFRVVAGGDLTVNGDGVINGVGNNKYCIAIWADGGKVTINGGTYTNVDAGSDDHYDLIYVKNGGSVVINGGTFIAETPDWTLNCHDDSYKAGNASITVYGGAFHGFNPYNNACEGENTNFVAEGKHASADANGVYTIHECTVEILEAKAPDCVNTGLTEGEKCTTCGEILVEQETVDALGHTPVTDAAVAPDCTNTGLTEGSHCDVCDEVLVKQEVVEAKGHDAGEAVVENNVDPTCTEAGSYDSVVYCSVCDDELSRNKVTVDKLGHTDGEVVVENEKAATCTAAGSYDNVTYCTVCKVETSRTTVAVDALGHAEIAHEAQTPTCTEIGWDAYVTCSRCSYSTYAEKAALGHAEVTHEAKAPTCTEIGWDAYVTCSRCSYSTYAEKAALGHDKVNHEAKAPTCTEIGWDAYEYCTACDYTTYAEKSATGHKNTVTVKAEAATCGKDGYTGDTYCNDCKTTIANGEPINATGNHSYGNWTTTQEPTYEAEGSRQKTCSVCGDVVTEAIPKMEAALDPVRNKTGSITPATVTPPATGWKIGENTFTVSCDVACIVTYTTVVDGETNYTRVDAKAITGEENTYSFTVTLAADTKIVIAIAGDVNESGVADSSDVMLISRSRLDDTHGAYRTLSAWEAIVGDVNGSGVADSSDVMLISRTRLDTTHGAYALMKWIY